jgi:hypothetical protein
MPILNFAGLIADKAKYGTPLLQGFGAFNPGTKHEKFLTHVKTQERPPNCLLSNMMTFTVCSFSDSHPFVLIVSLVWLTGVIGFSTWIIAALGIIGLFVSWRIYRRLQKFKPAWRRMVRIGDIVKEATRSERY